jgi:hypothetical protein
MLKRETIIAQTKKWIVDVVVGCNFCPFAAREVKRESIYYEVIEEGTIQTVMEALFAALIKMDKDEKIETMLLILPHRFVSFAAYLDLVATAETLIEKEGYEGIYQIASFHPDYLFAGSTANDPANYTNRSPYPMLHILREDSLSRVIDSHPDTLKIPENNIAYARQKGLAQMQLLREGCLNINR